jgi:hypothetical protein
VPSGLRMAPLLPLILTDLSVDRACALAALPTLGLLDKGYLLGFAFTAVLGLEFRACVLSCVLSFVISNSPLRRTVCLSNSVIQQVIAVG